MDKKEELLKELEALLTYNKEDLEIDKNLIKYLDNSTLENMIDKIKRRREKLIESEREWLFKLVN